MSGSRLVLGTVQFGLDYGIANTSGKPSAETVRRILTRAYECGIRKLDTAAAYGESESVLGRELAVLRLLDKVKIISKVAPLPPGISESEAEKFIMDSLEKSLANLGVSQLEAVLFHREADLRFLPILRKAQASGLIRKAGVSLDGGIPDDAYDCEAVQVPGNILDRRFLSFIRKAHANGTEIYNRSVYLQGLLVMPEEKIPLPLRELVPYRRELENLAREAGIAPAELYFRYLLSIPEIDGVLTGVDTAEQLEYNNSVAAAGGLPGEIMDKIWQVVPELPEKLIRPALWAKNQRA